MDFQIDQIVTDTEISQIEFLINFNNYRIFVIEKDYYCILAINHDNLICGCFEFHQSDDEMQLAHMYVSENHQRRGIGKAIIKQAVEILGSFLLPSNNSRNTYYYIEFGYSFIVSCFEDGILKSPAFRHPYD